jgi:UDP-glucuronate 4-epimerase
MHCLITGTAGFIGFHLAKRFLECGHRVTGIDGLTPYYDVRLKQDRHAQLQQFPDFTAHCYMLEEVDGLHQAVAGAEIDLIIHLAAQAGVRYSVENPQAFISSNLVGSFNVLELCRELRPRHLLIASTSSVYGANTKFPFAENDRADHPLTLYAASKKSVEAIAHCYSHLWGLPITVFRFFTAYGPWGRPDMALFKFVRNILGGRPIDIYNHGQMERDFTYIDDLVEAIVRLCGIIPKPQVGALAGYDATSPVAPYRIVNIGGGRPVPLLRFVEEIETVLGKHAIRNYMDMHPGDVMRTEASTEHLEALIGFCPRTPISCGIRNFVGWYRDYYQARPEEDAVTCQ